MEREKINVLENYRCGHTIFIKRNALSLHTVAVWATKIDLILKRRVKRSV